MELSGAVLQSNLKCAYWGDPYDRLRIDALPGFIREFSTALDEPQQSAGVQNDHSISPHSDSDRTSVGL